MDKKKSTYYENVKTEIRENQHSFKVLSILRILVVLTMIRQGFQGNYQSVFLCILSLFLMLVPAMLQVSLRIEIPPTFEIIMYLFIFAAEIMGEINSFYILIPHWDTILHTLNGFLAAALGCSLIAILNDNEKLTFHLSPFFVAFTGFCFSMTIGVLWEFFEFGMDYFWGLDMQKDTVIQQINSTYLDITRSNKVIKIPNIQSTYINEVTDLGVNGYLDIGLYDTMKDLLVNFIGAIVFSVFGYAYAKNPEKVDIVRRLIVKQMNRNKYK